MRVEGAGWRSESGVAHLLLAAVVVVVAGLAIAALYDSTRSSSPDQSPSGSTLAPTGGATRNIDAAAVARTVAPAVVDLDVSLADGGRASATGMMLTPAGEVVTNNHSIAGATAITARVAGTGRTYVGTVLGYDVSHDVAVVELADASGLPTIERADSSVLADGDPVVVIGSIAGVEGVPTPLAGEVTGLDRRVGAGSETLHGLVEIDVPTRAIDSGGPVVGAGGKVVAMTTAAPAGGRFREQTSDDMSFAIPIDDVFAVVDRVDAGQSTNTVHVGSRAELGVSVRPTAPAGGAGAYVVNVQRDGPAAQVGIAADTIIVSIDDTTVSTPAVLDATLDHYRPDDVVRVGWVGRDRVYRASDVRLGSGPPA
jgi:S1-C subfamily serine protease